MKVKKIISVIAAIGTIGIMSIPCMASSNVNISNTYVGGDLYIYVVNSGFTQYDSTIDINNAYIGEDLIIYQLTDDGSFIPINREWNIKNNNDFRGILPSIY